MNKRYKNQKEKLTKTACTRTIFNIQNKQQKTKFVDKNRYKH